MTNPNNSITSYGYEGANTLKRLTSVNNTKSTSVNISQFAYGYTDTAHKDSRSFMERKTGALGLQRVNYSYNNVDELTGEQATENSAIMGVPYVRNEYSYDRMGNRSNLTSRNITNTTSTQQVHGANTLNQLATVATTPYTGSTAGTATTNTYTYDAGGNMATQATSANSSGATYTYDDADRLSSFVSRTTAGVNSHWSSWTYDGLSRKKALREYSWSGTAWVLNSMKNYIYDGMDVVQERETIYAADGVTVSSTNQTNFTRTGNIGGILAKSTGTTTLTHLFFHYDGNGNVVSLTDASQNSVAEYSYDSYGNALTATGTQASSNAYRYSTKEFHSWTGFYDYGYRSYSPALGRWINRDPIAEAGGLNLYAMVTNNPVNLIDPDGKTPVPLITGIIGGVTNAAINGVTQKLQTGTVNWKNVAVAGGVGFVAGAMLPVTGLTWAGAAAAGASANVAQYGLTLAVNCKLDKFSTVDLALSAGTGAAGGIIGGRWIPVPKPVPGGRIWSPVTDTFKHWGGQLRKNITRGNLARGGFGSGLANWNFNPPGPVRIDPPMGSSPVYG